MTKQRRFHALAAIVLIAAVIAGIAPRISHAQDTCPGFMPSRLVAGGLAHSITGGAPVLMGEIDPSPADPTVLPSGATVLVLYGPECQFDTAQWRVDYNGTVGWLAEGEGQDYWLEPLPLPKLGATYVSSDGTVQYQYPAGWSVVEQESTQLILEPGITQLETGHFIVAVYPDAHQVESLATVQGTPLELLQADAAAGAQQAVTYSEPVPIMFGDYMAAYAYTTSPALGMDSIEFIVETEFGTHWAMVSALTLPGEISLAAPTAFAMAQSLVAPDAAPAPGSSGLDLSGLGASLGGSQTTGSTAAFVSADGSFSFAYPVDWIAAELDDNSVLIVNRPEVYEVSALDALVSGQLIVLLYPTLADTPDYPSGSNGTASTVVSYYASMGMISGYTQEGAMGMLTLGGRDASSSLAHAAGHDRLVIAVANGQGDFTVMIAYAAAGEIATYQPDLLALMGTVNQP
jgi:hypothetical protein